MAVSCDSLLSSKPCSKVHRWGNGEERAVVDGLEKKEERCRRLSDDARSMRSEKGTYSRPVDYAMMSGKE